MATISRAFSLQSTLGPLRVGTVELNISRCLSLSSPACGQKNFRKFSLGNKRGTRFFKQQRSEGKFPDMPVHTDVKPVGYYYGERFITVPEMVPELVVPDLTGFALKPYVSYRTPPITEDPFTAKDLFNVVYKTKIEFDFEKGKLSAEGLPLEPSLDEALTPEEARQLARKTGSDLFVEREKKHWEFLNIKLK